MAATCAMPLPMRPHPNTPTRLMSLMTLRSRGLCYPRGGAPGLINERISSARRTNAFTRETGRACSGRCSPPSRAECALERGKGADLRIPRNAVRVAPLHLEQLVLLHPRAQGAFDAAGVAGHDALGGEALRPRQPCDQAARRGHEAAGPLFEERLPQVTRRNADVLSQGKQLGLGEALADVVLPRLQLGRALNDALECLATDELTSHR